MRKRVIWLVVGCLIATALVMASCAAPAVEKEGKTVVGKVVEKEWKVEEEEAEEVVAPAGPEVPQYGGTLSFTISETASTFFDPINCSRAGQTILLTYDRLGIADVSRGPGGTGENPFSGTYCPIEYMTGNLAERWELTDLNNCTIYMKKGVRWQNLPPVNGREFTADDFISSLEYYQSDPQSLWYVSPKADPESLSVVTKVDQYTVHIYDPDPDPDMVHGFATWLIMIPHEVVEQYGDLSDWRHQVGTGPFILTDVVSASSVTWRRNPNYHMFDPFYPENRLPYPDTVRGLVIVDESTMLAALRTGKLDREFVSWDKASGVKQTNPELLHRQLLPAAPQLMFTRTDIEPFSDIRVRQALCLAIDQPGIARDYYDGQAFLQIWPMLPVFPEYTPLEELPEELQELYAYHPDKAKALLTEAGYPDGFKTECTVSSNDPRGIDILALVQEQLAKVGIDMEIKTQESNTFASILYSKTFPAMTLIDWANSGRIDAFGWAHGGSITRPAEGEEGEVVISIYDFGKVIDPVTEAAFTLWNETEDAAERTRILKENSIHEIEMVWEIPLPTPGTHVFWQPWLKGYHGERGTGPDPGFGTNGIYRFVWIDQDLKYELTGSRD